MHFRRYEGTGAKSQKCYCCFLVAFGRKSGSGASKSDSTDTLSGGFAALDGSPAAVTGGSAAMTDCSTALTGCSALMIECSPAATSISGEILFQPGTFFLFWKGSGSPGKGEEGTNEKNSDTAQKNAGRELLLAG